MQYTALEHFSISGDDPDQAARTYQDAYGGSRFSARRGPQEFTFRYASVGDDRVSLGSSACTGHLSGEVPHQRDYVVSWFRAGAGEVLSRDRATPLRPAEPFLLPAEQRFAVAFAPHRQSLVRFAPGFFEDIATEFHDGPPRAVSFDHDARPATDAVERWRAAVATASAALVDTATSPLLRLTAQRSLARAMLQLFPWVDVELPPALREPSLARTRIALEYLQHHAHEAITPADAARAAGMHTRTLQDATKRHLGESPSSYLRGVRLDRARRDLASASPETHTVAGVAHEWGFAHLGRFSAAYRERFGERPCDTLRR